MKFTNKRSEVISLYMGMWFGMLGAILLKSDWRALVLLPLICLMMYKIEFELIPKIKAKK